ncbi:MAG: rane protein [Actinoplanes sp.]|nr:rane protein [Actinoplanes sp.]
MKLLRTFGGKSNDANATATPDGAGPGGVPPGDVDPQHAGAGEHDHDLAAATTTRTGHDRSLEQINAGIAPPDPKAGPDGPTDLKGKGLLAAVKRTFQQYAANNISDWAAALTYYGILSIFPAALALVSVIGLLSSNGSTTVDNTIKQIVPNAQIQDLINQVLSQVKDTGIAGFAAIIGIILAFWSASGYVAAFMRASNAVYAVPEGRPIWKTLPIRLGVTAVIGVMLVVSAFIVIFTGSVAEAVGNVIGLGHQAVTVWSIVKWPVLIILVSLMFSILYWASPNARTGGFRWVSPGGVFAVLLWMIASVGFAVYLGNFANYNKTYGTLGSAIAFLVWLWISNLATLMGAELDAELERGRAIAAGHPADDEPFLQLRDDRKLKRGSEKGLSSRPPSSDPRRA